MVLALDAENEKLRVMVQTFKDMVFGKRSERLTAIVAEQLALELGDLETGVTPPAPANDDTPAAKSPGKPRKKARRNIGALPKHLPRCVAANVLKCRRFSECREISANLDVSNLGRLRPQPWHNGRSAGRARRGAYSTELSFTACNSSNTGATVAAPPAQPDAPPIGERAWRPETAEALLVARASPEARGLPRVRASPAEGAYVRQQRRDRVHAAAGW
jgi:hypothetical protein